MKVLVVGGGGREHAIIRKIKENPTVEQIFALPGNGGIAADAECVAIAATDVPAIVAFAKEQQVDYVAIMELTIKGMVMSVNMVLEDAKHQED